MPNQTQIDDILCEWEERRRQGVPASAESLCENRPELLETVKVQISALEKMYGVLTPNVVKSSLDPARLWPNPTGYDYLDFLGRGGMGAVFKAHDKVLDRVVAIKVIRDSRFANQHLLERFQQEAEAVAKLKHPNIVQVFSFDRDQEERPFYSLEFVNGGSLADHLVEETVTATKAADIVRQLARAMEEAHQHGIIHRDLKPANILLEFPGSAGAHAQPLDWNTCVPKITDFGIAKLTNVDNGFTNTGEVLGSPSYMAPEQASGDSNSASPSADIYSLGAILYHMLVGRPPFRGTSQLDTLDLLRNTEPIRPGLINASVPRDLENICLKCLEKSPAKRYENSVALAKDLERYLGGKPVLARPVSSISRSLKWCRRNPVLSAVTLLLCISLAVGTIGIVWNWQQAKRSQQIAEQNLQTAQDSIDQYLVDISEDVLFKRAWVSGPARSLA